MKKLKQKRQEQINRRKNFLPTFIISLLLFILLCLEIYFVPPDSFLAIFLFFLLLFFLLLFFFSILFSSKREGFLISLSACFFALLRYFGIGNILNFLLITAIAIAFEVYFIKNSFKVWLFLFLMYASF